LQNFFLEQTHFRATSLHPMYLKEYCLLNDYCRENYISYPASFFDPIWVFSSKDNTNVPFSSFFSKYSEKSNLTYYFNNTYAHHWHNQWKTSFDEDSIAMKYFKRFSNEVLLMS